MASFLENENPDSRTHPVTRRQTNPVTKTNRIMAIAAILTARLGRMAEKQCPLLPPPGAGTGFEAHPDATSLAVSGRLKLCVSPVPSICWPRYRLPPSALGDFVPNS